MPTADAAPRTPPPLLDLPALRRHTLDQVILIAAVVMTVAGIVAVKFGPVLAGWLS